MGRALRRASVLPSARGSAVGKRPRWHIGRCDCPQTDGNWRKVFRHRVLELGVGEALFVFESRSDIGKLIGAFARDHLPPNVRFGV
jgi:hypothetical protein